MAIACWSGVLGLDTFRIPLCWVMMRIQASRLAEFCATLGSLSEYSAAKGRESRLAEIPERTVPGTGEENALSPARTRGIVGALGRRPARNSMRDASGHRGIFFRGDPQPQ